MGIFQSSVNANFRLNTLKQTLRNENLTSGTSIIINSGDGIIGEDVTSGDGGAVPITAGSSTGGSGTDDGGDLFLLGGDSTNGTGGSANLSGGDGNIGGAVVVTGGLSTGSGNDGGDVILLGGDTSASGAGEGGGIFLTGNTPQSDGSGGVVTILSGSGGIAGGDNAGGKISLLAGSGIGLGVGGDIDIISGDTLTGSGTSRVHIKSGDGPAATGVGGSVELEGGQGAIGGLFLIEAGDSIGGIGIGGALSFASGRSFTGGSTGDVTIQVRAVPPAEASMGGRLLIKGGNTGTAGDGGEAEFAAGNTNDTTGGVQGGNVVINAGNSLSAGPGRGGDILLGTGQSSGSGSGGVVEIVRGGLQWNERASVFGPAITAGQGRVWLRNDTPNSLMFTDDQGTDIVISQIRDLANTLLIGNDTDGTDVILTAGDKMVPSSDGGANLGATVLRFGEIHTDNLELENLRRSSGNRTTVGATADVISGIYTLNSDGEAISVTVDLVGRSDIGGNALSQQLLYSFFRDGTVQNLATITNNTNYVGTLSTARASLSINGLAIDLVFTGEASNTLIWSANWNITHG